MRSCFAVGQGLNGGLSGPMRASQQALAFPGTQIGLTAPAGVIRMGMGDDGPLQPVAGDR
jgi:hypothetical protein